MKKNFDHSGVASFHIELFLMSISQQAYLATMTSALKLKTGNGIAEIWELGHYIQFQKDAKPPGDHYKDMVVLDPNMIISIADQSNQEQSNPIRLPISIWVRYHLQ